MANKPPSTKHIENALGIGEDLSKMPVKSFDEEKKAQFEERQKKLKDIQESFKKKRATYEQDKEFIKDMYKELAETGMIAVRIMEEEAGMTGDYKNVEALAAAANSVSQALDGLKAVELDEEKLRIEREKLDIRRQSANSILNKTPGITSQAGGVTNVFVGSQADLIRAIKEAEKQSKIEEKTVEAKAEIVETPAPAPVEETKEQ
jgi:hypothetical protein